MFVCLFQDVLLESSPAVGDGSPDPRLSPELDSCMFLSALSGVHSRAD